MANDWGNNGKPLKWGDLSQAQRKLAMNKWRKRHNAGDPKKGKN